MSKFNINIPKTKIVIALIASLIITVIGSKYMFVKNTPKTNKTFFKSLPSKLISFFSPPRKKEIIPEAILITVIPSPTISQIPLIKISPKLSITIPSKIISPTTRPIPTKIPPSPTSLPTIKPTFRPSITPSTSGCLTYSSQTYNSIRADKGSGEDYPINFPPENSPEINLHLRGYGPVNEGTGFIGRGGSTYGLDDQKPPQISSLYGDGRPKIVKTYIVYEWDFQNNKSNKPNPATPNYKVTMIGLDTTPGKPLKGLVAGRKIDENGDVFMVLYATKNDIVFTHSNGDSLLGGYLFFFLDICVDPNLLSAYEKDNAAGRGQLPAVGPGQTFGYGSNMDAKVVVRDTMSFMDTRYNEDWWDYK